MIIRTESHPRAGLVGNPSDGYNGKTISFLFTNYRAEVVLWESPELEILPNTRDTSVFDSIEHLAGDVRLYGYYGGIRLLKATIKRFHDYCREQKIPLHDRNFTLRYRSDIPHGVGLAGSSAIIAACLRALCAFYKVSIPKPVQPNVIWSVEIDELKIGGGLQDRVIQTYGGMVYMDFGKEIMARQGYGCYERMDPDLLPPVYIAYDTQLSETSDVFHNNIRERYNRGEPAVVEAMKFWADLTDRVRECLLSGERDKLGPLLNSNFDRRRQIYKISPRNIAMVEAARSVGASSKFSGSGGAVVGTYKDEAMYRRLEKVFEPMGIKILKPALAQPID
jgi:glucuronokinase